MKNRLYRKILAVGIIVLFIGVSVSSGFAVVNLEEKDTKNNSSIILDYSVFNVDTSTDKILNFEFIISNTTDDPASKNFKVYTYPYEEDLSYYLDDDKIDVSFTPSREGVYSVIVEAEDENNIVEKSISYYIVNPKGEGIVRYFFRDINPTHGQPGSNIGEDGDHGDCKALLLSPPTDEEYWFCSQWIQNSPDEVQENIPLFTIIKKIDIYFWYKFLNPGSGIGWKHGIGIQRFATPEWFVNSFISIPLVGSYKWINTKIDLSWIMVSPSSWYKLSLKLIGMSFLMILPCYGPQWMTKPEQPSYADFYYSFSKNANVRSTSNSDIRVLSATSPKNDDKNAEIILEGTGNTNLVIEMPDSSQKYSAKLDNEICVLTQKKGILTFELNLNSKNSEHILKIYPSQNNRSLKCFTNHIFTNHW